MYKAKQDFLWYKVGDEIETQDLVNVESWLKSDLVVETDKNVKKDKKVFDKVSDVVEDLLDDGKLNDSNKKKKSKSKKRK